jgi:asparagine synthetase B (glutamine-hydrolysing)
VRDTALWAERSREEREYWSSGGSDSQLLALHAALRALSDPEVSVRWVDTEGAFNAARAQAVLNHLGLEVSRNWGGTR